jgi:hypothetical protein
MTSALVLALALGACSQFNIRSDFDPQADFSRLHTWAWLPLSEAEPADQRVLDRLVDMRIREAAAAELRSKGYTQTDAAQPDFLLNYRVGREAGSDVGKPGRIGYGTGWWRSWGTSTWAVSYDDGTLFLGVIDPRSRQSMWVGAAEARLMPRLSDEQVSKRVRDAVHQILARFPPKAAGQ